jgi:hypothetical protein
MTFFDEWVALARSPPIARVIFDRKIKLRGNVECVGPCPRCGGKDRFGINNQKQVFNCRGCGVGGDIIALVQLLDDCNFIEACEHLTGLPCPNGREHEPVDQAKLAKLQAQREQYARDQREHEQQARADAKRKGELAAWLWSRREPVTEDCPVAKYLRRRGYTEAIPATLGYLPAGDRHPPAMIAAFGIGDEPEPGIIAPPAEVRAVHITRLALNGDRERGDKAKIILGPAGNDPIILAPANDLLAIDVTEGVENGLMYLQARHCGVWVAGNAGRLPMLAPSFPSYVEVVNIFADDDEIGIAKGQELARALRAKGGIEINLKRGR